MWPYAVRHAQYVRNRSYQQRTGKTAYELFTSSKPDMWWLHTYGADCTYYNEGPKQKFDARGYLGRYIGFNLSSQGYYILTENSRVITTRNVTIHTKQSSLETQSNEEYPSRRPIQTTTSDERDNSIEQRTAEPIDNSVPTTHADAPATTSSDTTPVQDAPQRRSNRDRRPPQYLTDYDLNITTSIDHAYTAVPHIPSSYDEAISCDEAAHWRTAMDREIRMLEDNNTWEVETLPDGRNETKGRWEYTLKQGKEPGEVQYKARYVAKGFSQIQGVDYDETYTPTTRFTSIRALLQKSTNEGLNIHQLDVKGAYLNAPIDTDLYLQQPPGYEVSSDNNQHMTCHLKKSIYGLKQSGRNWHHTLINFLKGEGFTVNEQDPCVFSRTTNGEEVVILFWVDDILVAAKQMAHINSVKKMLSEKFKMDDRGELRWFLGIDFKRSENGSYTMSQERYSN